MHVVGHELRFWKKMRENIGIVCSGDGVGAGVGAHAGVGPGVGPGAGAVACEDC
jgi:hypothetical protein